MKRLHLFEFEDLAWMPKAMRNVVTDVLREAVVLRGDVYRAVAPTLAAVVRQQRASRVIDLCSGAGGPWPLLKHRLADEQADVELVFTDRYPNNAAFHHVVARIGDGSTGFEPDPVDATDVPARLTGVRTLFTSFHHLHPTTARHVLRDAFEQRTSICVFEFTERHWRPALFSVVAGPLLAWAYVPRIRPVTIGRLVFTYLLPVTPIVVAWDGMVSNLRTYSQEELSEMVETLSAPDYMWQIGCLPGPGRHRPPVTYLIGQPDVGEANTVKATVR